MMMVDVVLEILEVGMVVIDGGVIDTESNGVGSGGDSGIQGNDEDGNVNGCDDNNNGNGDGNGGGCGNGDGDEDGSN